MKKFLKYIDKKKSKLYSMFGLLILIFSFINFSSADYSLEYLTGGNLTSLPNNNGLTLLYTANSSNDTVGDIFCFSGFVNNGGTLNSSKLRVGFFQGLTYNSVNNPSGISFFSSDISNFYTKQNVIFLCFSYYSTLVNYLGISSSSSSSFSDLNIDYSLYKLVVSGGGSSDCSSIESDLEICQSDLSSCQNNSLTQEECNLQYSGYVSPTIYQNCTNSLNSCSGELGVCNSSLNSCLNGNYTGGNWSSLFINDIQHLGSANIFIDIPEEISWDYSYTGQNMNIDIEGYNVDSDYIEGIIDTQTNKPDKVDLNNIITGLIPLFVPGFVIILFIYFAFRLIKKIF